MQMCSDSGSSSVLFVCTYNSIRSPMAEGLAKKHLGQSIYLQSAGVEGGQLDPMVAEVLKEWDIDIAQHHARPFEDLFDTNFDCVISLSEPARDMVKKISNDYSWTTYHWDVINPTEIEGSRTQKLERFCDLRNQLHKKIVEMFPLR